MIVGVRHHERPVEQRGARDDGVRGAPRSCTRRPGPVLEDEVDVEVTERGGGSAHLAVELAPDDHDDMVHAGRCGLACGEDEERLAGRPDSGELLGPAVAATEPGGEDDERRHRVHVGL